MRERRFVVAAFTANLIADLVFAKKNVFRVLDRLPDGALIINSGFDQYKDEFYFVLEHESFKIVPPGKEAPKIYITYESFDIDDLLKKKRRLEAFENAGLPVPKEEEHAHE
jgi:hypothetical protein